MDLFLEMFRGHPVQAVTAGETLIEQDSRTGRLFILIEGKVEVIKNGEVVAWSSQPGDILGDISALLDLPHTTTVRATRDCRFYVFDNAREFLERNPAVSVHLCELLARRLVSVTSYLAEIKRQFAGHDHIGMIDEVLDKLMHRTPRARVPGRRSEIDTGDAI
ncbi:MAG TPA: cyclic nucleotide-binding domain-containing protein [Candidatus Methylacidiphilales bacterium]|jgi:CRP-like cAMP-binding protein|nr:cyclic nucleotide-binding domain-containing protein [Candidatus Methylacidiphilales bacterium]